jgi:SAM-dependent methyltransferase
MISIPESETKQVLSSWDEWLRSPAGKYILEWEQKQFDQAVTDAFGFQALQIGLPDLACLRENRIPNRFLLLTPEDENSSLLNNPVTQLCRGLVDELPFANESLDLITLPHVLEFAQNPHDVIREVNRVLRPEGRLVISGFNPMSLWGARQHLSRFIGRPFLPTQGQFISHLRIKDWLHLLDYSIDRGRFGCYRFPSKSEGGMQRMGFMEKAGDRWWPVLGSVFTLSAVKRVTGMKLVGRIKKKRSSLRTSLAPATNNSINTPTQVTSVTSSVNTPE